MENEVIIIGAGPSGLTAALYLGRYERKTLVVAENIGGQAVIAGAVENFPGSAVIHGTQIIQNLKNQVNRLLSVSFEIGDKVVSVDKSKGGFTVRTKTKVYYGKTVLIASGRRHKTLGFSNEKELVGKGLSYCATCDGPFAKDKDTVVIGGGNAAIEAALILVKVAKSVTLLNLTENICGERITLEKVKANPKIKVINRASTKEIKTANGVIRSVLYEDMVSRKLNEIPAQMVFVEIGKIPNSEYILKLVKLNENKEIIIDFASNLTSTEGVFGCGDVTQIPAKQIVVACGEGAKAAIAIDRYLEKQT